jgi:SH3-like domain-containing protein
VGTEVELTDGQVTDADGVEWQEVRTSAGETGWVVAAALSDDPPGPPPPPALPTGVLTAPGFAGVNLRQGPASLYSLIRPVPVGTQVVLIGAPIRNEEVMWQQVRTPQGEVGWVLAGAIDNIRR